MNHRAWRDADKASPPIGAVCEVQAVDRDGRYRLPFPVRYERSGWHNARWDTRIVAQIFQWRPWRGEAS